MGLVRAGFSGVVGVVLKGLPTGRGRREVASGRGGGAGSLRCRLERAELVL